MNQPLSIVFAGTPEFALPTLTRLIHSKHQVVAVYTQPDRPKGRGKVVVQSPVKQLALTHHLPVMQPLHLRNTEAQAALAQFAPDLIVVVAYGLILPKAILNIPRLGCINIHASLLPKYRGASPIQQAILHGDSQTGVSLMQMDEGLDTGDILKMVKCAVEPEDTAACLHDKLATLGSVALLDLLVSLRSGEVVREKQDESQRSYAPKIKKQDGLIDWQQDATDIVRKILAYNPWPVAFTFFKGQPLRLWLAQSLKSKTTDNSVTGQIIHVSKDGIDVTCNDGLLRITQLQLPGSKKITARDFFNAHANQFPVGSVLGQ